MKLNIEIDEYEARVLVGEALRARHSLPEYESLEVTIVNKTSIVKTPFNPSNKIELIKFLRTAIGDLSYKRQITINNNPPEGVAYTKIYDDLRVGLADAKHYVEEYFGW